jgi:hypothetical protein
VRIELAGDEVTTNLGGHRFKPGEGDADALRELVVGEQTCQPRKKMAS